MKAVSKSEFEKNIKRFFEKESGMSINDAMRKLKEMVKIDKWGNTHNDQINAGNVVMRYTHNINYAGGLKNGFGRGIYLSNAGFTGGSTIKLKNSL